MAEQVTNVVVAGLGGQGVLKASDILADAAFRAGWDVKKAEVHGMSQRGGSVSCDVRYGREVFSPMVPAGEAECLVVLEAAEIPANQGRLRANGRLIAPDAVDEKLLTNKRALNVALLGVLSRYLDLPEESWHAALKANLPEKYLDLNLQAFQAGRTAAK